MALALAVLLASLLGSLHCAAMCGGFVCWYAGAESGAGPSRNGGAHLAYNAGRLVSYLTLGAVAGIAGAALDQAGTLAGVSRLAALISGGLMVLWGVRALLVARGARLGIGSVPGWWQRGMGSVLQRVRTRSSVLRAAITGLVTTLLPCGWLYAFVVTAAGTGSVPGSAAIMAVFWAGTLPMMVTIGLGARRVLGPIRTRLPLVSAGMIVVVGLLTIALRMEWIPGLELLHALLPAGSTGDAASGMVSHVAR